jgi:methyl-accepting chemotaxis protein
MLPINLRNFSVQALVRLGILAILLLTSALVIVALMLASQVERLDQWSSHTYEVQAMLENFNTEIARNDSGHRGYAMTGDRQFLVDISSLEALEGRLQQTQQMMADNPSQLSRVSDLRRAIQAKFDLYSELLETRKNLEPETAKGFAQKGMELTRAVASQVQEMNSVEQNLLKQRRENLKDTLFRLKLCLVLGLTTDLVLGILVYQYIGKRLDPLDECASFAERIGRGNLTSDPMKVVADDEVGRVSVSLNQMLVNLRQLTSQNVRHAGQLKDSSSKIAHASREQAIAQHQKTTALQQMSVTLEELTQSANQIAERSRDVVSRAQSTAKSAHTGLESVTKSLRLTQALVEQVQVAAERVNALAEKTEAIRNVVLSVNDIAERSNVLALNASILAVAAGEEGQGFTVVAYEMKNLADQSKEATVLVRNLLGDVEKGIHSSVSLIGEAAQRAGAGYSFTGEATVVIEDLTGQVNEASQAFQQIVAATNQQNLAFEQVASALLSIKQASHQSSFVTEQLQEATLELSNLSGELLVSLETYELPAQRQSSK